MTTPDLTHDEKPIPRCKCGLPLAVLCDRCVDLVNERAMAKLQNAMKTVIGKLGLK